ncbi:hypothetical protein BDR22DRAFT_424216 [Usnea florida]
MRIHQLLPFASLALAMPHPTSNTKRQFATPCGINETWTINQYHTCTNCTYPGSTQETTSLSFEFTDPNFNPPVTATCELSVLPGSSLIQPFDYTGCGSGVAFWYDGDDLEVERTGVQCGNHTFTYQGAVGVSGVTFCYELFGGTYCETPTQLNVPVSFIQQTSAK